MNEDGFDVNRLIESDPERYMIIAFDNGSEGEIFIGKDGGKVEIIKADCPRKGLCLVDRQSTKDRNEGDIFERQQKVPQEKALDIKQGGMENEPNIFGFLDYLLKDFGVLTISRIRQRLSNGTESLYTEMEFQRLPSLVFKAESTVSCLVKLMEFVIEKYKDLLPILENKGMRNNLRRSISKLSSI